MILIAACDGARDVNWDKASEANITNQREEATMTSSQIRTGNPMVWDGVVIHRPKKLANSSYDRGTYTVVDLDTGDALKTSRPTGQGDSDRTFGFYNKDNPGPYPISSPYVGGIYFNFSDRKTEIFTITKIYKGTGGTHREVSQAEYDASRLAEMFRAQYDAFGTPEKSVIVVDARPKTSDEISSQRAAK